MMLNFYHGKRVLVTGHTGFKGSWLVTWLKQLGAEVCAIALPPDVTPCIHDLADVSHGIEAHFFDIGDLPRVQATIRSFQPEIVFHLAAQALVRQSYDTPVETWLANVMGSIHVLEAVRRTSSVRAVVMITSDKVYHNDETDRAFAEEDRLGGNDPYSSSKAGAEIAIQSWRKSFFTAPGAAMIATARAGNVFGGGDWSANRLLPDIVRAVSSRQDVVLRNPDATRPWQHVLDVLSGYLLLGARLAAREAGADDAWNFGPLNGEELSVSAFAERVVSAFGRGCIVIIPQADAPSEAQTLRLDSRKSARQLRWRPILPIDTAVEWSVAWYCQVMDNPASAASATLKQIEDFMALMAGKTEIGQ